MVNASIDTEKGEITYHDAEHLGVAVDTERGLLVPVVKDAGDLNIAGLARKIADLAERTRNNKITPDELGGGTFTLTNTGSRGALFDTPIINQPQVGILGTGAVVKRAVVVDDPDLGETIAIRSMCYLALSYDHRIVDGADAARFLTHGQGAARGGLVRVRPRALMTGRSTDAMKVVLTGASGLLGPALAASLRADGHEVVRLVRRTPTAPDEAQWEPDGGDRRRRRAPRRRRSSSTWPASGWAAGRGPRPIGARCMDSRVRGTTTIAKAVAEHGRAARWSRRPASATTATPATASATEDSPRGDDLRRRRRGRLGGDAPSRPPRRASAWCRCAPASCCRPRAVRTASCCRSSGSGSAAGSAPAGSGGRGSRWTTTSGPCASSLDHDDLTGPVNVTAPEPLTNARDDRGHGPGAAPADGLHVAPGWAMKVPLRDFAEDLLGGQRVVPRRLLDAGLRLRAPELRAGAARGAGHRLTPARRRRPATRGRPRPARRSRTAAPGPRVARRRCPRRRPAGTPASGR